MSELNDTLDYDYDSNSSSFEYIGDDATRTKIKYMYTGIYSVILLLGLPLNMLVIYVTFCKRKKTRAVFWLMGLAVNDLVVCLLLPLQIISAYEDFTWRFRGTMCKLCSYGWFMNMHSTALIVTFLFLHLRLSTLTSRTARCTCDTCNIPINMVLLSWFIAALLSIPSLFYRSTKPTIRGKICYDDMPYETEWVVVSIHLISGLVVPLAVTILSTCLVSSKIKYSVEYRIIRAVFIAYFVCWVPYHILRAMKLNWSSYPELNTVGLPISTVLSVFNSCINPIIYILKGKSVSMDWMENIIYRERTRQVRKQEVISGQSLVETHGKEEC